MTMLAKYNSKINSPDIWLEPLILVISFTLANMILENIEEASVNGLIQWFHVAGTYSLAAVVYFEMSSRPDPAASKMVRFQCTNKSARSFSQLQNLLIGPNSIERTFCAQRKMQGETLRSSCSWDWSSSYRDHISAMTLRWFFPPSAHQLIVLFAAAAPARTLRNLFFLKSFKMYA